MEMSRSISSNDLLHPQNLYTLVCRPALPKDTPQALELTSHIWEGQDYVPHVWESWLRDHSGLLAVAEYGGRVVGLGKLTLLAPGEWWLEGLRVHPQYEGRGVASHLHDYLLHHWERRGEGVIRLFTGSYNQRVQHLCQRSGFRKVGEFTPYIAASLGEGKHRFRPVLPGEAAAALEFALKTRTETCPDGLMDVGWRRVNLSLERLKDAIDRQRAWWWGQRGTSRQALLLASDEEDEQGPFLLVQYLACPLESLKQCLLDARYLAAALNFPRLGWFAPLHPQLEAILSSVAFEREWDDSVYLYEKAHSTAG